MHQSNPPEDDQRADDQRAAEQTSNVLAKSPRELGEAATSDEQDTARLGGLIRDSFSQDVPETDSKLRHAILSKLDGRVAPVHQRSTDLYWWVGGLAALAASVIVLLNINAFRATRTTMNVKLGSGTDLVYEIDAKDNNPASVETEPRSITMPPVQFRTEVRTRQVPVTTMMTDAKTRPVPVTKSRTETRTREVTIDGKKRTESYQVAVPYTEYVEQSYTVQVPKTTYRTETYTVQVPVMSPQTETYTVKVPVGESALKKDNKALSGDKTAAQRKLSELSASRKTNNFTTQEAKISEAEQKASWELARNRATPYFETPQADTEPAQTGFAGTGSVKTLRLQAGYEMAIAKPFVEEGEVQLLRSKQRSFEIKGRKISRELSTALTQLNESNEALLSSTEKYEAIPENEFVAVEGQDALSTFAIDVDTASYSNARRFLQNGQLPPPDAVRVEEFLNYFTYDYPQPDDDEPFSVNMEVAQCPWNRENKLLRIGLKGKEIERNKRPASNLVFLLDVSGSMKSPDKLALMKRGLKMMLRQLREDDFVSIVTYAGNAGVALDTTSGDQYQRIADVIDSLGAGGSTNGSAGIDRAYELAVQNFVKDGTNRVILATDGDLNVGITDDDALTKLITSKAGEGVFLTVLGFGTGNLKDAKMEKLADNGNGNYAYIDSVREAHKVLVQQMSGSLVTIAKDVKLQLEFNPKQVKAYRLIGYENRALATKDFDDDQKDAGEIGAGHTVTAIYELVTTVSPKKSKPKAAKPAKLKYQAATSDHTDAQATPMKLSEAADTDDLLTLALRYKQPEADKSKRLEYICEDSQKPFAKASNDFRFASSVASFAMLLRQSKHTRDATFESCEKAASETIGDDPHGYRSEFVDLIRAAKELK